MDQPQMGFCMSDGHEITEATLFQFKTPSRHHLLSNFVITPEPFIVEHGDEKLPFWSIEAAYGHRKLSTTGCSRAITDALLAGGSLGKKDGLTVKRYHRHAVTLKDHHWELLGEQLPSYMRKCILARAKVDPAFKDLLCEHVRAKVPIFHFERAKNYFRKGKEEGGDTTEWFGSNFLGDLMFACGMELCNQRL